ncbi:Hypothetical protein GbCGDNIH9_1697 [Granulibacter bethesdensis]|uniref:CRISPR-associated protein, Cse3 family n=1 Tax=Granulibacter bethesdensis TaxID=364410 RepID=A0AAC9P990_9PROT|nr:type I-E CRISPR-associated protein Cas6/Cse3/CasE [Granulibacter bethesdensis]APH54995.1 Hypothetical protein GbCGDNIH9_1697 [Granulibacter bethesdensis]APH62581.1 Hypothetical protein GbCGDNIH8_1697 [Granulibacter bethesdensis]
MLHLIHLPIEARSFAQWAGNRGFGPKGTQDNDAVLHHLLTQIFGRQALQPFRVFTPEQANWSLYGYADQDAATLAEQARFSITPDMMEVVSLERLRSKAMPEAKMGQRIGFDVRIRPVRRASIEKIEDVEKLRERDAFLAEALHDHADNKSGMKEANRSRENVYVDWLKERMPWATLETARLAHFQRRRVLRNGKGIEGPDATIHGTMVISDPVQFFEALRKGIGRHSAYGYGMMMLRPPDALAPDR